MGKSDNRKSIFKIIKDFFMRNKQKKLPEPAYIKENPNDKKEFKNSLKTKTPTVNPMNTIEFAIEQFLFSYLHNYEHGNTNPYSALVSLGGVVEPDESNREQEASFLNLLRESGIYNITEQRGKQFVENNDIEDIYTQGKADFYHVQNAKDIDFKSLNTRIYLNPKRSNIILMVSELTEKTEDIPFYLKFESDKQLSDSASVGNSRSEKIVIYCNSNENGNFWQVLNVLEQIKKEKPFLFEGCQNVNPFLKSVDGMICYANNPTTNVYNKLDGRQTRIPKSYNSFLSTALEESMAKALIDIEKMKGFEEYSKMHSIDSLTGLLSKHPDLLIANIKRNLAQCQMNNDVLDIKGIENRDNQNMKE